MSSNSRSLIPRCGNCQSTHDLLRCTRCRVQHYCSRQCQTSNFASHKSACIAILKTFSHMKAEEAKLREHPGDWALPKDPFTNGIGRFWGLLGTRDYMRARFAYIERLARVNTYDSTVMQLDYVMECLRLCRGDNMGVRDMAPHLMLRLDKDQEAYDFVKWHQTKGREADYDWGNMKLGFLDVKDADCFEDVSYLCSRWLGLSQVVAVTLLKVKMLLDLISLQQSADKKSVPKNIPVEILNSIRNHVVRSPVIKAKKEVMVDEDQQARIGNLVQQIKKLYNAVDKANKHFWPALHNPGGFLEARPVGYSTGDVSEVQHILKFTYDAWMETPGAFEAVRGISKP